MLLFSSANLSRLLFSHSSVAACTAFPFLYLRSVTGEFPELITGGAPRVQQGLNHLHAEGVQGDCLITFSTTWLKTAHKSLVHMGLATCVRMVTCTVVNTAIKGTTILHVDIMRCHLGTCRDQYSYYPTKKNCKLWTKFTIYRLYRKIYNHEMTFKYRVAVDAQMFDRQASFHKLFPWIMGV